MQSKCISLLSLLLALLLACGCVGCGSSAGNDESSGEDESTVATTTLGTSSSADQSTTTHNSTEKVPTTVTQSTTGKKTTNTTTDISPVSTASSTKPAVQQYYDATIGMWYCVWWDSVGQPYFTHHWENETRSTPVRFGRYATDDIEKLTWDFNYFKKIGIDYLILDDTNNHQADGGNIATHINAIFKAAKQLGTNKAPQLCIAGGSPLLNGNAALMESEMAIFAGYAKAYKDTYFRWKGKPLYVNFVLPDLFKYDHEAFTVRNACGHTSEAANHALAGKYDIQTEGLYGWVFDQEFKGAEAYGVNPGWSRSHNGLSSGSPEKSRENGDLYRRMWLRALKAKPEMVVIASWNDHAEETGIEAVNLSETISGREEEAANPYLYEQMTEGYLALKTGYVKDFYYKAENDTQVYQYTGSVLKKVSSVPADGVLLWIPDDYYAWAGVPRK